MTMLLHTGRAFNLMTLAELEARPAVLYWLHDASCRDPRRDGYVGITGRHAMPTRLRQHRRSGRFPDDLSITPLQVGNRLDCLVAEFEYRPRPRVGWNRNPGGGKLRRFLQDIGHAVQS